MNSQQAMEKVQARFGAVISHPLEFRGEFTVIVPREKIVEICQFLKECGFDMLTDLSGVDNYGENPRFEVAYHLYSIAQRCRLRLKVKLDEDEMFLDTVTGVWRTADWHEREAYDMFGIRFRGHPDLKRILMWEGYPHYPLRKDFPLAGIPGELPDIEAGAGQVETAPMLGGPFVPGSGTRNSILREPRKFDTAAEREDKLANPNKKEKV